MVPVNRPNKDGQPSAEGEEGRTMIKENVNQQHTHLTQGGTGVSQRLEGVLTEARENKELRFTTLLHHMTVDLLRGSFFALKRRAAPGVDGVTWQDQVRFMVDIRAASEYFTRNTPYALPGDRKMPIISTLNRCRGNYLLRSRQSQRIHRFSQLYEVNSPD